MPWPVCGISQYSTLASAVLQGLVHAVRVLDVDARVEAAHARAGSQVEFVDQLQPGEFAASSAGSCRARGPVVLAVVAAADAAPLDILDRSYTPIEPIAQR
jgi:hypothetical protein